jgi:hypothetical protein
MILLSPDAVDDVERLRAFLDQSNPDAATRTGVDLDGDRATSGIS